AYPIRGGECTDHYTGRVVIDRRTWRQTATSFSAYQLKWGDLVVSAEAEVVFTADEREVTLEIGLAAREGDTTVAKRTRRAAHARRAGRTKRTAIRRGPALADAAGGPGGVPAAPRAPPPP